MLKLRPRSSGRRPGAGQILDRDVVEHERRAHQGGGREQRVELLPQVAAEHGDAGQHGAHQHRHAHADGVGKAPRVDTERERQHGVERREHADQELARAQLQREQGHHDLAAGVAAVDRDAEEDDQVHECGDR